MRAPHGRGVGGGVGVADREGVATSLQRVRERIAAAEARARRPAGSVVLMAVSKLHPVGALREAYAAGQRVFGENYAQELAEKADELGDLVDLELHMIGHLQSNKAKVAARHAAAVHTIDSVEIASELARRAGALGRVLPVSIEVNVGGEAQKHGCAPAVVERVVEAVRGLSALSLRGLMTVPPHTEDPEGARPYFARLRELRDALGGERALPELSMGMSHDLEQAVAEGATVVRVGTAIFGARGG